MKRDELRAINLQRLKNRYRSIAELAIRSQTDPNYISQILNRHLNKTGKPRTVGNDLADRIEDGCDLYRGWLDIDHDNPPPTLGNLSPTEQELVELWRLADDALRDHIMALARLAK